MSNNLHEVAEIMGIDEETIKVYPKIKFERNLLNPWGDELLNIFRMLNLSSQKNSVRYPMWSGWCFGIFGKRIRCIS